MSKLRGKSESILIDDKMLYEAAIERIHDKQAKKIVAEEGIDFGEVLKLRLEYKNILRIHHLWEFTSLNSLDLNNNLIEKIQALDHLVCLTRLNLSFNRIQKIEGLESLRKLEVLNLTHNRISVIENMDALEKLTYFSIGDNHLEQLDSVLYLRKFKKLLTLKLCGNPMSENEDYTFFIAAFLPQLNFLDYNLLDKKTKNEASIKHNAALEEIIEKELQMQKAAEAKQIQEAEVKLHMDAFVESLNGSYLFKSMIKDDPEAEILHCVPGVAHVLTAFEQQIVALCMQLFDIGLAEHKQRETELGSFFSGQSQTMSAYQQIASQMLAAFDQQHRRSLVELQQLSDPELLKVKITHTYDEISQLCNSLMALEFQLIGQLEDMIKQLDVNISDMIGSFSETAQGIFVQCRDLEDDYHARVQVIAVATLEIVAKEEQNLPDDVKMLFTDRDTVMDALATSHDNHLMKINDRETLLVTRINAWKVGLIKEIQEKAVKYNHMRISDIQRYADYLREQLKEQDISAT